jgi:hypothetical protein
VNNSITTYNNALSATDKAIANLLAKEISKNLPEAENKNIVKCKENWSG